MRVCLPHIYNNVECLVSCDSSHITSMTGKNHKSNQPIKDNFDTDGVSIDIDDLCSVTMSHYKQ